MIKISLIGMLTMLSFNILASEATAELETKNEKEQISVNQENENVNPHELDSSSRIKIIINEKERLRSIQDRRFDDGETSLTKNYIRNTPYTTHVQGLMREASFYMQYLIKNYNRKEMIELEARNMAWNAICLSGIMKQNTEIIFNMLQVSIYDEGSENEIRYLEGSKNAIEVFSNFETPSKDEVNIRCYEIYENKNINQKD